MNYHTMALENEISRLKSISRSKRIVIYGAGYIADMVASFFDRINIEYIGFCESNCREDARRFHNHQVYSVSKYLDDKDVYFFLAMNENNAHESIDLLNKLVSKEYYEYRQHTLQLIQIEERISRVGEVVIKDNCLIQVGNHYFDTNKVYVCCPCSIGDTLFISAFAGEIRKQFLGKPLVYIMKEHQADIGKMFYEIDSVLISNELVSSLETISECERIWRLNNYFYGYFKKTPVDCLYNEYYSDESLNMIQRYERYVLRKKNDVKRAEMLVPDEAGNKLDDAINKKTVILFPYAETVKQLPLLFWEKLTRHLHSMGYDVWTNVKDEQEEVVRGTRRLSESIGVTACIAQKAFICISVRSGICDLLSMTSARLVVLNTEEFFYKIWNVNAITNRDGIYNLCCFDEEWSHLISSIMRIICEGEM